MGFDATTRQSIAAALQKAANCSTLAAQATSPQSRALYVHLRDSWIEIANNLQVLTGEAGRNIHIRDLLDPGVNGPRGNRGH